MFWVSTTIRGISGCTTGVRCPWTIRSAGRLKASGQAYYTISSAGHEDDAVLGAQLRPTDPCFLHYRSGGLMMARSRQDRSVDAVLDTMLSLCAKKDDPIAEGRHKDALTRHHDMTRVVTDR